MYESPYPPDPEKQCYECKHYYQGHDNGVRCEAGHGSDEWSLVDSAGTCENWEER